MNRILSPKYVCIILLALLCQISSFSQTYIVKSLVKTPTDLSARTNVRLDQNNASCSLLKTYVGDVNVTFSGNVIGEYNKVDSEYWVYMSPGSTKLEIHIGDNSIPIIFKDYGIEELEEKCTYHLVITQGASLWITVTPEESDVYIDNKLVGKTPLILNGLLEGVYSVSIKAPGFNDFTTNAELISGKPLRIDGELFNFIHDGVDFSIVYDSDYFRNRYKEEVSEINDERELFVYFLNTGLNNRMVASPDFDVNIYRENYNDLRAMYGDDMNAYYKHYIQHGKKEGRNATSFIDRVKEGDYYYSDGTTTHQLNPEKELIGIVFSTDVSEKERNQGFTNGYVISINDLNINGKKFFTWDEAMSQAKKHSVQCGRTTTGWYLPSADQWNMVFNNIGRKEELKIINIDINYPPNMRESDYEWNYLSFWTSTDVTEKAYYTWRLSDDMSLGRNTNWAEKRMQHKVRPVFAF